MTDIAQILGVNEGKVASAAVAAPPPPPPQLNKAAHKVQKAALSREVMHLMSAGDYHTVGGGRGGSGNGEVAPSSSLAGMGLPPAVPTFRSEILGDGTSESEKQVKVGSKWIRTDKPARKWAWAPFTSSARTDGALFHHWVRAGVEYPDYPYSRFDIHLDPVAYTDDEYKRHLMSENWTRGETDALMDMARVFELRWAVIHDRWIEQQPHVRNVEELQHRYYWVAAKVGQIRISHEAAKEVQALVAATPTTLSAADDASKIIATENLLVEAAAARALATSEGSTQPLISNLGTGSTNKVFDLDAERERRAHLNALWYRSKDDEVEEFEIRKELKQVEAQLRKLKKSGVHIVAQAAAAAAAQASSATGTATAAGGLPIGGVPPFAAGAASAATSAAPSAASSRNPSRAVSPTTAATTLIETAASAVEHAMNSTAPVPTARTPYLQSGRLSPPNAGGGGVGVSGGAGALLSGSTAGINKALLARMDAVLAELKVDTSALVPTKRVCDLYDTVRRDILTLLILQKNLFQKEAMLESKRLKLAKMGGSLPGSAAAAVLDEEALMGIVPPPQPAPAAAAASAAAASTGARGPTGAAAGGKSSKGGPGGKQAKPGAGGGKGKSAAAGSKPKGGGGGPTDETAAPGAKKAKEPKDDGKPKKPAVKRKRVKSDASSAVGVATTKMPPPSATGAGTAEASTETSTAVATVPSAASASAAAATPVVTTSTGPAVPRKTDDGKPAKKRAKKAAPSAP